MLPSLPPIPAPLGTGQRTETARAGHKRAPAVLLLAASFATGVGGLGGCLERRLTITSEPPGAIVWLNDAELGRTPVDSGFTYYGTYDVRLRLEGYEPVWLGKKVSAPLYEYPPLDLAAMASPVPIESNFHWHFVLEPSAETIQPRQQTEAALLDRAGQFRQNLGAGPERSVPEPNAPDDIEP